MTEVYRCTVRTVDRIGRQIEDLFVQRRSLLRRLEYCPDPPMHVFGRFLGIGGMTEFRQQME